MTWSGKSCNAVERFDWKLEVELLAGSDSVSTEESMENRSSCDGKVAALTKENMYEQTR